MPFREYWFTYICVFLTGCLAVFIYSVIRDFAVWGRITVLESAFWENLLPFNFLVFIAVFGIALGLIYASNIIERKKVFQ